MATGLVDNWLNIDQFGAIYPFVGSEGLLAFLGIVFWLGWHLIQICKEHKEFNEDIRLYKEKGIAAVLDEENKREIEDIIGGGR